MDAQGFQFHKDLADCFYGRCTLVASTWAESTGTGTERLQSFLRDLGKTHCQTLLGLDARDVDYLVLEKATKFQARSLQNLRTKVFVHIRSVRETCDAYESLGYWPLPDERKPLPDAGALRGLESFLGEFVVHVGEVTQLQLEGKIPHGGRSLVSSIDTQLFAACSVLQSSAQADPELCRIAREVACTQLVNHLMGIGVHVIEDPANLLWAVNLALADSDFLEGLAGRSGDVLTRKCELVRRAARSVPENILKIPGDFGDRTEFELNPEMYGERIRSLCFVVINALQIQHRLASDHALRRNPEHVQDWHVMDELNERIDVYWHALFDEGSPARSPCDLNLYILGLLNRTAINWLSFARTEERWKEMERCYFSANSKSFLSGEDIETLQEKNRTDMLTADKKFAFRINAVIDEVQEFLKGPSFSHPFVVAITGTPGTGKSTLAKLLIKQMAGCKVDIQPLNLSTVVDVPGKWWNVFVQESAFAKIEGKNGRPAFQAVIIDEADSTRSQAGSSDAFWYQWLLQPLWDPWPDLEKELKSRPRWMLKRDVHSTRRGYSVFPTVVFVIGSRKPTWYSWYTEAVRENKGNDFVSRIDDVLEFPPFSPEDQLLIAGHLSKDKYSGITKEMARIICRARFEYSARSLESLLKHCRPDCQQPWAQEHLPASGNYSQKGILLTGRSV